MYDGGNIFTKTLTRFAMKRFLILLTVLLQLAEAGAQLADTTIRHKVPATWKKAKIAPRIELGTQRAFYAEAGFALQRYIFEERHGFVAYATHASFHWVPARSGRETVYGIKAGFESVNNGGSGGIDLMYVWNNESKDVMIIPKIGFGLGMVNLFYGYAFSTSKYPLAGVRKNQFSLVFNTNLIFYQNKIEKETSGH
jgi:hypothetical protein